MEILFHNHRIVPGHMGGTYEPRNVLRCNVAMHAFMHKCLWEQHGHRADLKAWQTLTGLIGREGERRANASKAVKALWENPEYKAKMLAVISNPSEAVTRQRVKRMKGNTLSLGHRHTPESLSKMSQRALTRWSALSDAQKAVTSAKMSAAQTARTDKHNRGLKHSPEARARMRAAAQAREQRKRDSRG